MEINQSGSQNKEQIFRDLIKLESTLNITLPIMYKEFLMAGKNSLVMKKCFTRKIDDLPQVLAIDFFSSVASILSYQLDYVDEEVTEAELMLIGHALGTKIICIGIGETNKGKIFVFDWDFGPTFQANNLNEFLDSLFDCE